MTSKDSLIESARPISEAEARIEAALRWASAARTVSLHFPDAERASYLGHALDTVIRLLDGGKS